MTPTEQLLCDAHEALQWAEMYTGDTRADEKVQEAKRRISAILAATSQQAEGEPVGEVITIVQGRNAGKQVRLLRDLPNGTKLYAAPLPAQPQGQGADGAVPDLTACANCLRPKQEHRGRLCPHPYTTTFHAWGYDQPQPTYLEYERPTASQESAQSIKEE